MKKLAFLCVVLLSSSCVATDIGNPQTDEETESEVQLAVFEEEIANALMLDDGIELTHAWVATERISLEGCESESESENEGESESEDDDEFEYRVPSVTDLFSSTTFPAPIVVRQRTPNVCTFSMEIRPLSAEELPAGAPADLAGRSMLVRGLRKDGNPFVVHATFEETFELEGEIALDTDLRNKFVLGFAVNGWLTQQQLGALTGDPILINEDTNTAVYEAFADTVSESLRLFRDEIASGPIAR